MSFGLSAQSFWMIIIIWVVICVVDYRLTIIIKKRIKIKLGNHIRHEGSIELNPLIRSDVEKNRFLSPLHISFCLLSSVGLFILWRFCSDQMTIQQFQFTLGLLILPHLIIYLHHLSNIGALKSYTEGSISGTIQYSKEYDLKRSIWEVAGICILFFILAFLEGSQFLLGGVFGSFFLAIYLILDHKIFSNLNKRNT